MVERWVAHVAAWGLWGLAALFLLEGLGLPLPAEIPLVLSGGLAHAGRYPFWTLVSVAWGATVAGNVLGYGAGYLGGRPLVERLAAWAGMSEERLERMEAWVRRHGMKIVFFTRWINWGFGQSLWLAGISRVPPTRFVPFMLALNFCWAVVWVWFGSLIARWLDHLGLTRGANRHRGGSPDRRRPGRPGPPSPEPTGGVRNRAPGRNRPTEESETDMAGSRHVA